MKKMLEGCSRSRQTVDTRAPITRKVLTVIISQLAKVCYNDFERSLFNAMFTLAYFGPFRVSELVATATYSYQLQIAVVRVTGDRHAILVTLRKHKTNQRGIPVTIRIPYEPESVCVQFGRLQTTSQYDPIKSVHNLSDYESTHWLEWTLGFRRSIST